MKIRLGDLRRIIKEEVESSMQPSVEQLEKEIARAADSGVNAVNLERKKSRKYDLRHNLPKILDHLSEYALMVRVLGSYPRYKGG